MISRKSFRFSLKFLNVVIWVAQEVSLKKKRKENLSPGVSRSCGGGGRGGSSVFMCPLELQGQKARRGLLLMVR